MDEIYCSCFIFNPFKFLTYFIIAGFNSDIGLMMWYSNFSLLGYHNLLHLYVLGNAPGLEVVAWGRGSQKGDCFQLWFYRDFNGRVQILNVA